MTATLEHRDGRSRWLRLRAWLRNLYLGNSGRAYLFRYWLLAFDVAVVAFIVGTSFIERSVVIEGLDFLIGVVVLMDILARFAISRRPWRELLRPVTWADLVALASFILPVAGEGAAFLRILRTLRLVRSFRLLAQLRQDFPFFKRNEEVLFAALNLSVFLFIMTGIVYETQRHTNPAIGNYADALYFTVTALTTTGFGDITLPGTSGRLISVAIMIFGVTLFLRLAQVLFRPNKVRFPCPRCGLQRHDPDAVHCKACGEILNIPDEGAS
jgi:voltage-gated potassium channel